MEREQVLPCRNSSRKPKNSPEMSQAFSIDTRANDSTSSRKQTDLPPISSRLLSGELRLAPRSAQAIGIEIPKNGGGGSGGGRSRQEPQARW